MMQLSSRVRVIRKAGARTFLDEQKFMPTSTSRTTWTPEIRMLDKDEKLPEVTLETKMRDDFRLRPHPFMVFPPMDPLNPTWEQRRSNNTNVGTHHYGDRLIPQHHMGFRTIPPELIDWRTTMYGDLFEELPHYNKKVTYSMPDYTLAGLLNSPEEDIRFADTVPRTVEETPFARPLNPKLDHWQRWLASRNDRGRVWNATRFMVFFTCFMMIFWWSNMLFQHFEHMRRQGRTWWEGANAGTWKYGGMRANHIGQFMTGGHVVPIIEW
ncbi:hypothetical protein DIPPA_02327 [Diplonema papillatum]|nr:hypothetical protein DIPPA_02327 [Diplonema papillatum]